MKTSPQQHRTCLALVETVKECYCLDSIVGRFHQALHPSGAGINMTLTLSEERRITYWILRTGEIKETVLRYFDPETQTQTSKVTLVRSQASE